MPVAEQVEAKTHPAPPPRPPKFFARHHLFAQVSNLAEVGSGDFWILDENGEEKRGITSRIPSEKLPAFVEAIAAGRVYVWCGHRYEAYDEVPEPWCASRRELRRALRHRRATWNHVPKDRPRHDDDAE